MKKRQEYDSDELRTESKRREVVQVLDGARLLPFQGRTRERALLRRHPAAERDGGLAHGTHAEQHDSGRAGSSGAAVGAQRLLGAGDGPRVDSHGGEGGGTPRRAGDKEDRPDAGGVSAARLGMDGGARGHHPEATAQAGSLVRLGADGVHHGRTAVGERDSGIRGPLPEGSDLPGRAHGELGPEGVDGVVGRGGGLQGRAQQAVLSAI